MDFLLQWDIAAFQWINGWRLPSELEWFLIVIRNRYIWLPLYLGIITWILTRYDLSRSSYILIFLFSGIIISDISSSRIFKKSIKRVRPCNEIALQARIEERIKCRYSFSFPSSHATNHFAIATLLIGLFKKERQKWWFWTLYTWAMAISVAQVFVGVHYPLDILGGALLGIVLMRLYVSTLRKIYAGHKELNSIFGELDN